MDKNTTRVVIALLGFVMAVQFMLADVEASVPPTNSKPITPGLNPPPHPSFAQPPVDPKYCLEICSHRCTKEKTRGTYEICHHMCMMECEATGHISPDIPPTRRYKDAKKVAEYVN